ncbi:prevent-host-death protein [Streptomyces sp. NPDC002690]
MESKSAQPEIDQRDLPDRPREIMDAAQGGQSFTVTRGECPIGEPIPLRRPRRFVSRHKFAATSRTGPDLVLDPFRADQDATADTFLDGPSPG